MRTSIEARPNALVDPDGSRDSIGSLAVRLASELRELAGRDATVVLVAGPDEFNWDGVLNAAETDGLSPCRPGEPPFREHPRAAYAPSENLDSFGPDRPRAILPIVAADRLVGFALLDCRSPEACETTSHSSPLATAAAWIDSAAGRECPKDAWRTSAERLVLGFAHDFSKQLAWICSVTRRLSETAVYAEPARGDLDAIAEIARCMTGRLKAILGTFKGQDQRESIGLEEVALRAVRSVERCRPSASITLSIEDTLRRVAVSLLIETIMENLLDNAVLAGPPGSEVKARLHSKGSSLLISIEDRGIGMSGDIPSRAFDLGFTTRGSSGNTGLGLPATRAAVELLGGKVELQSTRDHGTCARVTIPMRTGFASNQV